MEVILIVLVMTMNFFHDRVFLIKMYVGYTLFTGHKGH
jgi:hypothetical protein